VGVKDNLKKYVENNHCSEIAGIFCSSREFVRAKAYTDLFYKKFIMNWISLHACAVSARSELLNQLQQNIELEDAIALNYDVHKSEQLSIADSSSSLSASVVSRRSLAAVLAQWDLSHPSRTDPLFVWDNVLRSRELAVRDHQSFESMEHVAAFHVNIALAAIGTHTFCVCVCVFLFYLHAHMLTHCFVYR
jgi:hypothetical protein